MTTEIGKGKLEKFLIDDKEVTEDEMEDYLIKNKDGVVNVSHLGSSEDKQLIFKINTKEIKPIDEKELENIKKKIIIDNCDIKSNLISSPDIPMLLPQSIIDKLKLKPVNGVTAWIGVYIEGEDGKCYKWTDEVIKEHASLVLDIEKYGIPVEKKKKYSLLKRMWLKIINLFKNFSERKIKKEIDKALLDNIEWSRKREQYLSKTYQQS